MSPSASMQDTFMQTARSVSQLWLANRAGHTFVHGGCGVTTTVLCPNNGGACRNPQEQLDIAYETMVDIGGSFVARDCTLCKRVRCNVCLCTLY